MQITYNDIEKLILIGRTDTTADKDLYLYFKTRDYINRQHGDTWKSHVASISDEDLIFLFNGLVKLEQELQWIGGSVAGAIWVYNVISQRRLDNDYSIADFGLRNCNNPWVPFGGSYYGRRTITDYFAYQNEKGRISVIKADRYEKVLRRVTGRKFQRAAAIAELRKLTSNERGQAKAKLLENFATKTPRERLEAIASDTKYPPEYYPSEWIDITREQIENLPTELIKKLSDKLSTKTRGKWKRFAIALRELDDGI